MYSLNEFMEAKRETYLQGRIDVLEILAVCNFPIEKETITRMLEQCKQAQEEGHNNGLR